MQEQRSTAAVAVVAGYSNGCANLSFSRCIMSVVEMIYKTNEMKQIFRQHYAGVLCYRCQVIVVSLSYERWHRAASNIFRLVPIVGPVPMIAHKCPQKPIDQCNAHVNHKVITFWLFAQSRRCSWIHSCNNEMARAHGPGPAACTQQRHNVKAKSFLSIFSSVLQVCTTNMHILNSDPNKVFCARTCAKESWREKQRSQLTMTTRNAKTAHTFSPGQQNEMHNKCRAMKF